MKVNALLDVNIVAHESSDEVAILLELEAPAIAVDAERPPAALQVVLDRSGSMNGAPLDGAKEALIALVRRLRPSDNVGLVTFADSVGRLPAGDSRDSPGRACWWHDAGHLRRTRQRGHPEGR